MSTGPGAGARLRFLTDDHVRTLHDASLRILERTGIRLDHDEAAALLADHGAAWDKTTRRVRIPPDLVMRSVAAAPKSFHLYTRTLERALPVSATTRITHNSGGPAYIRDPQTGERREGRLQDVIDAAIVVDALRNIDCYIPLVSPADVMPKAVEAEAFNIALRHTVKPLVSSVLSDREVRFLHRAYSVVAGSEQALREKPLFAIGCSPVSPLVVSAEVASALLFAARAGVPTRFLPCPMLGGTTPVTFAGGLALQNAEALAGLVIAQAARAGTPFVVTPRLTAINMRTGACVVTTPDVARASACATELTHFYGLPVDAFAVAGGWPALDEQMGLEKGMNAIVAVLVGVNWLTGFGSIDAGTCSSIEQLVIDDEILSMALHLAAPFEISEETLALDVIDHVGPGGSFMGERHTVKHMRDPYTSKLAAPPRPDQPIFEGRHDIVSMARERVREILRTHKPQPLPDDVTRELDKIMESTRREYAEL